MTRGAEVDTTRSYQAPPALQTVYGAGVRRGLAVALALICSACTDGGEEGASAEDTSSTASGSGSASAGTEGDFGSLIDQEAWAAIDAVDDPLPDHRPPEVDCDVGWYIEDEELEVDTNLCNYLALVQPSLRPIEVGDTLDVHFYHFDLVAPEPAEAHLQVSVDGNVVWDYLVPIPTDIENNKTPAAVIHETVTAEFSAPLGSAVRVHLHNHGQNTWTFVDLAVVEP